MPTLEFEGKAFVYSHHLSVPYRELVPVADKGLGASDLDGNLIIHGDNLEALKALLPQYAGKVDVIYIDPPYNTGKEGWRYDDKVNSPLMQTWLGNVVDKDDLQRHDKWLCMMWPRLQLLCELLNQNTGVIFISIDDNELHHLTAIMDDLLGANNHLGTIVWKSATDNNPTRIAVEHEYIVCYATNQSALPRQWQNREGEARDLMLQMFADIKAKSGGEEKAVRAEWLSFVKSAKSALGDLYRYRLIDDHGPYVARRNLENPGKPGYDYEVLHPVTGKKCARPYWLWRFPEEAMNDLIKNGRIIFGKDEAKIPELKVYLEDVGFPLRSVLNFDGRKGSNDLEAIFGSRDVFKNPKPRELIEYILGFVTDPNGLVLDSFAGSGTTGHAVLAANAKDGGSRRFVLVETEDYADSLTAERVRRVINGVATAKDEDLRVGLGGAFTYCELGEPMDAERFFAGETAPAWEQVARYVLFTATGETASVPSEPTDDFFAAEAGGRRVHVIYRPDRDFLRSADAALTLERARAISATAKASGKSALVFGAALYVSARQLRDLDITFAQLPWSVHQRLSGVST